MNKILSFISSWLIAISGVWILIFCLSTCCPDYYPICSNTPTPNNEIVSRPIGNVYSNGEICKVEEIFSIKYDITCSLPSYNIDKKNRCRSNPACESLIARRIICPSGNNSENKIGDDGTKFHRQIIQ